MVAETRAGLHVVNVRPHTASIECTLCGFSVAVHIGGMRNATNAKEFAQKLFDEHICANITTTTIATTTPNNEGS